MKLTFHFLEYSKSAVIACKLGSISIRISCEEEVVIFTGLRVLVLLFLDSFLGKNQRFFEVFRLIFEKKVENLTKYVFFCYTDPMYPVHLSSYGRQPFKSRLNKKVQPSFTHLTLIQNG